MLGESNKAVAVSSTEFAGLPERCAREPFTWRRMESWQIWSLAALSVALLVATVASRVV